MSEARGREAERPGAGRVYVIIKYREFRVFWIHYPVSGVGEAGCPFGSR